MLSCVIMEDFLVGGGFFDDNDDNEAQQESLWNPPPPLQDVSTVLRLVDHNEDDEDCHVLSSVRLRAQTEFVQCHMGSLELCQGYRGDITATSMRSAILLETLEVWLGPILQCSSDSPL